MRFYVPQGAVEWYATKYDNCTVQLTGNEYRHQNGSGRADVIKRFAAAGKTLGDITKEAAQSGYDPNFVVDSIFKHTMAPKASLAVVAPEGTTLEEIRKLRKERRVDPATAEKRAQVAEAKAAKAAEREAAKADREQQRAQRQAEREAKAKEREDAKAAKAAEREAAKAAKAAEATATPAKGKGKRKPPADDASGAGEAEAA